jgi:uncharacterized protein
MPMSTDSEITAAEVVACLRAHEAELRAAGIRHLSLFGSVARGEAGPDSDIDLAAEFDRDTHITLIGLARLEFVLGDLLGRKVDLLTEPIQKPQVRANIDRDRRHVF